MESIKVITLDQYKADCGLMTSGDNKLFEGLRMNTEGMDMSDIVATLKGMFPADVDWEKLGALADKSTLGKAYDLPLQ